MISLTIIAKTLEQGNEIVSLLLKKRLIIEGTMQTKSKCFRLDAKKNILETNSVILICTTKSLLFTRIDTLLKERYKDDMPVLYSVPIVNMDWEQSKKLIEETKNV